MMTQIKDGLKAVMVFVAMMAVAMGIRYAVWYPDIFQEMFH